MVNRHKYIETAALFSLYGLVISALFSIVLVEIFAGLLFLLWGLHLITVEDGWVKRSLITWVLLVFVGLRLLSIPFSVNIGASLKVFEKLPLLLLFFPIYSLFERKRLLQAAIIFAIAAAVAALLGGARVALFGLDRARTTYGGYTGLSLQLVIATSLALGIAFIDKSRRWILLLLPILIFGLTATFARTQWVSATIALIFIVATVKPKYLHYLLAGIAVLASIAPESVFVRFLETFRYGWDSSRLHIWSGGFRLLENLPFMGYGPYTFGYIFPDDIWNLVIDKKVWNYHNDFLQILLESGAMAMILLAALWGMIFRVAVRATRDADIFKISVSGAFIGLFLSSIFNGVILDPMVMPIFAFLLAILRDDKFPELCDGDRVLLVRTDRLGDVILTTPMARVLREKFPGVKVDMMTKGYCADIASMHPDIDRVFAFDSIFSTSQSIHDSDYAAAVLVHPDLKAALALAFSRIPLRIGTGFRLWSPFLLTCRILRHRRTDRHEMRLNLDLLKPFDIDPDMEIAPRLELEENSRDDAEQLLAENGYSGGTLVVFHPGSGGSTLKCPPEIFGKAAKLLIERDVEIAVTGSGSDKHETATFLSTAGNAVIVLSEKTDIILLAGVLDRADVVIASGRGPLHLGAALGTPVVGVYPPSKTSGPVRWGPLGSKSIIIRPNLEECERCRGKSCPHYNCMELIEPDKIVEAVLKLINARA